MRGERETTELLRDWIQETLSAVPPPERTVTEVLRRLPATRQVDAAPTSGQAGMPGGMTVRGMALPGGAKLAVAALAVAGSMAAGFVLRDALPAIIETASPSPTIARDGARTLVVDARDPGAFSTITAAVAASRDGDTVLIRPGTYVERVVVTTDIAITGDGAPGSVVVLAVDDPSGQPPSAGARPERNAFVLLDSAATLADLTIGGPEVATAIRIEGGAPTLERIIVDLDGDQDGADPIQPHESVSVWGGSRAVIRDSSFDGFVNVEGASPISFIGNRVDGGCIYLLDPGTDAIVRGNTITASICPTFAIGVKEGAKPLIEGNTIDGGPLLGIELTGAGTDPILRSNTVSRIATAVWVSGGAEPLIEGNTLRLSDTGLSITGSRVVVRDNDVWENQVGIVVQGDADAQLDDNRFLDNHVAVRFDGAMRGSSLRGGSWCTNGTNVEVSSGPAPTVTGDFSCVSSVSPSSGP